MTSPPLSLVGLAVVGKNNEPLYVCDCTLLSSSPATMNNNPEDDVFGFLENARTGDLAQSLPIQHQFLVHAALDRLDEILNVTKSPPELGVKLSGMPVRRKPNPSMGPHWLGVLLNVADEWKVYGHVTATNMKIFALTTAESKDDERVKIFLEQIHSLVIAYIMNCFHSVREFGAIRSQRFDRGVKDAVSAYYNPPAEEEDKD